MDKDGTEKMDTRLPRIPKETYGIIENLVATGIFFCPNLIFLFVLPDSRLWIVYNFIVMLLLISAMSHINGKLLIDWDENNKDNNKDIDEKEEEE